jgi:hypothetical protein
MPITSCLHRGLFKLDLGVLTSWDEVVTEFYRAPARWWWKCMSQMGNDNQLSQLKQSMFIEDNATGGVTQVCGEMCGCFSLPQW